TMYVGLELVMASVLVGLFVFTRYYNLPFDDFNRSIALGFCLYSLSFVLNNTVIEYLGDSYSTAWNVVHSFAFLATLVIWVVAARKPVAPMEGKSELLPESVYGEIIPVVNDRLTILNDRLATFWKVRGEP